MSDHGGGGPRPPTQELGPPPSEEPGEPEYELTDYDRHPLDDDDADDIEAPAAPEYALVDHTPPPPDHLVIAREAARRHWVQQNWVLGTFIGVFVVVILSDLGLSSGLSAKSWAQVEPEVSDIRNSMLAVFLVIIGYFFGDSKHRLR